MFTYKLILIACLVFFAQTAPALGSKDFLPVDQAFKFSSTVIANDKLELAWSIADGYHLYRDKFKIQSQTEGILVGKIEMPDSAMDHDPVFGEVAIYRHTVKLNVPLENPNHEQTLKLLVKYQGCADVGVCYPPQKLILEISLPTNSLPESNNPISQFKQGLKSLTADVFSKELLPPEQAFQFFANVKDSHTLHVSWIAAEGYFLYKNKLALSLNPDSQTRLESYQLPIGEEHADPEFGQVQIYRRETSVDIPLFRHNQQPEAIVLTSKFQGCADRGVCYPPMQASLELSLPIADTVAGKPSADNLGKLSEQDKIVQSLQQDSLALTLASFFGFGILLAFTPCIFPMIPILSGIIVGQSGKITTRKAFLLSLSYVIASALMYTVFGVLAAVFGSNLQAAFQNPWIIAAFSAIFVLLSLSMFGFYSLEMPKTLQSIAISSSDKHRDGSYFGAAMMGALSALIVGPCVAAPLAAALIYIGQTGDVILGGSALFVMGLGMGLPLLFLGASAGKILPKAGAWMNTTKSVFGVIMLAVAAWMLSRILPAAATMLLSALLLIIPSIYLKAIEPLPASASGWQKLWKGIGICMLCFGILQLIGLSAGNRDIFQPLQGLGNHDRPSDKSEIVFEKIKNLSELSAGIKLASDRGKPLMLDFYADWCVSCKEMQAYTFSDAKVQKALSGYVLLQADVTENNADDKALLKQFDLIGPPGIIFFDKQGQEKKSDRVIGFQDAATFLNTLSQ